jgi:hypothetical protein
VCAAQGVVIAQTVTANGKPTMNEVQVTQERMRADIDSPNGRQTVIFDGPKQVLYIINTARKSYMEMNKADADQFGAQMSGMMAQASKMLESMPAAQRAQMEAMLKGRGVAVGGPAAKPEYVKGGTQKVGKWTCDVYEMRTEGQRAGEVCTVSPQALGFSPADFAVTRQMAEFVRGMSPQSAENLFQVGRVEEEGFSGVPVRRVSTVLGREVITEVTDTRRQDVPDSMFVVPTDFTKQALGVFGPRGGGRGTDPAGR